MIVRTTAGELSIVQETPDLARVTGHKEALQALIDGIEMSGGGSLSLENVVFDSHHIGGKIVTKERLAIWIQFEILNYLTYTEFPDGTTEAQD